MRTYIVVAVALLGSTAALARGDLHAYHQANDPSWSCKRLDPRFPKAFRDKCAECEAKGMHFYQDNLPNDALDFASGRGHCENVVPANAKIERLRSVLSEIEAYYNAEGEKEKEDKKVKWGMARFQHKLEWSIDDSGLFVWKTGLNTCMQLVIRAKLSDLDLRKVLATDKSEPGWVWLTIPCKRGKCVRSEFGSDVWPVYEGWENCPGGTRREDVESFGHGIRLGPYRDELLNALRSKGG